MIDSAARHHASRLKSERRFRLYGKLALGFALCCLVLLLGSILVRGVGAFMQTQIQLDVTLDESRLDLEAGQTVKDLSPARFNVLWRDALQNKFPQVTSRVEQKQLQRLVGSAAGVVLKDRLEKSSEQTEKKQTIWLPASSATDGWLAHEKVDMLSQVQINALAELKKEGRLTRGFNRLFFTQADSRSPESAGYLGAMAGSFFTMLVCLFAAFPLGVMAAVYLEEFSRKNRWVDLIEVNINNLAAVPSIVYGLLGLSVYINMMHMPRSAPIVGGLTLALMVLPVIIISTRSALKSVPPSIRQAALALGASPLQTMWHHTLPLAMPGVMTGTILGMARAIGETAPLLMIGMVAFVADVPSGFTSAATAMPVQIFLWASSSESGFVEKTAAAILVLLVLLLMMNAVAIYVRKKCEVRW